MRSHLNTGAHQRQTIDATTQSRHDRKIQRRIDDFMDTVNTLMPSRTGKLTCLRYLLDPKAKVLSDSKSAQGFNDKFAQFKQELDLALGQSKKESNRQEFVDGLMTALAKEGFRNDYNSYVAKSGELPMNELLSWIREKQMEINLPKMKERSHSQPVMPAPPSPTLTTQTTTQTTTTSTQPVLVPGPMVMQQPVQMTNPTGYPPLMSSYPPGTNFVPVGGYFPTVMPMQAMQVPAPAFPQQQPVMLMQYPPMGVPNGMMGNAYAQFPPMMMGQPVAAPMNTMPAQQPGIPQPYPQTIIQQPVTPQAYPQTMLQQPGIPQPYPQTIIQQPATPQAAVQAPVSSGPQSAPAQAAAPKSLPTQAAVPSSPRVPTEKATSAEKVNINAPLSQNGRDQLGAAFRLFTDAKFNRQGTITVVKYLVNGEIPAPAQNQGAQRFNDKFFQFTNSFDAIANRVDSDERMNWNFQVIRQVAFTQFNAAEIALLTTRFAINESRMEIVGWLNTLY